MKSLNFSTKTITVILLTLFTIISVPSRAQVYRIQYVSEQDDNFLYDLNKVENKRVYILPNGSKLYFTSDKFSCYSSAEQELERMLACGFKTSKIRTFHNHKIASSNYQIARNSCN